jgi:putative protease
MRKLATLEPPKFKSPVQVIIEGKVGQPLTVSIIDERSGKTGVADSEEMGLLEQAKGSALNEESIFKAVGTLGNTEYSISSIDLDALDDGVWCPMSWVKDARRRAIENLSNILADMPDDKSMNSKQSTSTKMSNDDFVVDQLLDEIAGSDIAAGRGIQSSPRLSVLARNFEQVDAICTSIIENNSNDIEPRVSEIIVDFLEIEGIRSAVSRVRDANDKSNKNIRIVVASPRIIKPGEEGIWRTLLKQGPDAILVRSTGLLHRLTQLGGTGQRLSIQSTEGDTTEVTTVTIPELIGDFSLNAANAITAHELLQAGLSRVTAAYDLSAHAITELATLLGKSAQHLEVVVHQHMPIFHTEHCVCE